MKDMVLAAPPLFTPEWTRQHDELIALCNNAMQIAYDDHMVWFVLSTDEREYRVMNREVFTGERVIAYPHAAFDYFHVEMPRMRG